MRLRGPLGGSSEAGQRLIALLCQWPLMPCQIRYVNSGREKILDAEDWQNEWVSLSLGIDPTTGADCLDIRDHHYSHPAVSEYDRPPEFFVRSADVTRELERLSSTAKRPGKRAEADYLAAWYRDEQQDLRATAAPPPPPPASHTAPDQQLEDKAGPDPSKIEASHPPAAPPSTAAAPAVSEVAAQDAPRPTAGSRDQRQIMKFVAEEFPNGWENVETRDIIKRVGDKMKAMKLKVPRRDTFNRALGRRPK